MTSAVGKMFNSILNPRLDDLLCKKNIINNCQIGFTKNATTSYHMFIIKLLVINIVKQRLGRSMPALWTSRKLLIQSFTLVLKSNFSQSELVQSFTKLSKTCMK